MNVYFSLGSNIGSKKLNLNNAKKMLNKTVGRIITESKLYESEPWGNENQNKFINQCLICDTNLSIWDILDASQQIEILLGKNKKEHWGPRTIDIDILFYGNSIIDYDDLIIPHPYLHKRNFVLEPLNEISPEFIHPVLKKNIAELFHISKDHKKINIIC